MSLSRYNPFDGFPLSLRDPSGWATDLFGLRPSFPVDVYEDESSYFIEASLPGMTSAGISSRIKSSGSAPGAVSRS